MATEIKIDFDNTYMNVIKFGHGTKNMVMISGVSLCGSEGQGEAIENAYEIFSNDYTVYLFDRKKVLPENYLVADMAQDIFIALQKLNVHEADVLGASQGGMMALWLAINHPSFVKKLAVCSTSHRKNNSPENVLYEWMRLSKEHDVVALNRSFFKNVYSTSFLEKYREIIPELEKIGTDEDCDRFSILAEACIKFDVHDDLEKIKCPVLLLGDKNDKVFSVDNNYEMAEKLDSEIFIYDSYSHAVYDEAEDFKERVKDFFDR